MAEKGKVDITVILKDSKGDPLEEERQYLCEKCEKVFGKKVSDTLTLGAVMQTALLVPERDVDYKEQKKRYKLFNRIDRAEGDGLSEVELTSAENIIIMKLIPKAYPSSLVGGQACILIDGDGEEEEEEEPKKKGKKEK